VRCMQGQVDRVAVLFQHKRTLGQSPAALKAAAGSLGLCGPDMPPITGAPQPIKSRVSGWNCSPF
jgi:hypothetical protein